MVLKQTTWLSGKRLWSLCEPDTRGNASPNGFVLAAALTAALTQTCYLKLRPASPSPVLLACPSRITI